MTKLCECGCGQPAPIAPRTYARFGHVKGQPIRFIHNHHGRRYGTKVKTSGGYILVRMPDHPNAMAQGYVLEHVLVASKALGKPLPPGVVVHHVNSVRDDNRPENLVVCEGHPYHRLVHHRQDALNACGHAGYLLCPYCREWDDPSRMYVRKGTSRGEHRECRRAHAS